MIVRTYGRRTRDFSRNTSFSDSFLDVDPDTDHDLDESPSQDTQIQTPPRGDRYSFFSSQDSSPWCLDADLAADKRPRKRLRDAPESSAAAATATLMEAQEFGEMMEHVDEVNFALDGLRPRQPFRIRRASLLSLLSICGSALQRRLLRTQGMAKKIVDAILSLNFDDSPSTVAAAALFFVLASDAQDDHLLDSPLCIQFLLKLLNPSRTNVVEDITTNISSKFLGLRMPQVLNVTNNGMDSSSATIFSKVQEILLNCKEIRSGSRNDDGTSRPELSSKWISLLTMEKACLSTVSFEDTSEPVKKAGGNFKERLRELGGLDAIFDVVTDCHSVMEKWINRKLPSVSALKDGSTLESVAFLLKCLKIMENATFLSKDNQDHLLCIKGKSDSEPISFVRVIISSIKFLSGFSLVQSSLNLSTKGKQNCQSENVDTGLNHISQVQGKHRTGNKGSISAADAASTYHKCQSLSASTSGFCTSGLDITVPISSKHSAKNKTDCHSSDLHDREFSSSYEHNHIKASGLNRDAIGAKVNINEHGLKVNPHKSACGWLSIRTTVSDTNSYKPSKRPQTSEDVKGESATDCYDPFAFDDDQLEPSKWERLSRKKESPLTSTLTDKQNSKGHDIFSFDADPMLNQSTNGGRRDSMLSQPADGDSRDPMRNLLTNGESSQSCENICSFEGEEDSNLLEDCLLASVKVLMNLTNDNPVGCQQIAACGGLDTMVSLIVNHFPSYDLLSPMDSQLKEDTISSSQTTSGGRKNNKHLTDHGLDFLVAILGLLVNLVEKDSRNRLRLVSAPVLVEGSGLSDGKEKQKDVIPLLCSIFLANQGAGEAAEEGRPLLCDDEALMQGEHEAEMMIVEAYAALLLAFLSTESADVREAIASYLPNHNLESLVPVLERFVAFHLSLNMISPETHSTVKKVIESCKGS